MKYNLSIDAMQSDTEQLLARTRAAEPVQCWIHHEDERQCPHFIRDGRKDTSAPKASWLQVSLAY